MATRPARRSANGPKVPADIKAPQTVPASTPAASGAKNDALPDVAASVAAPNAKRDDDLVSIW